MAWSKIRGHEKLVPYFAKIVAQGRLAHAYLFVGPDGIGKKLFAKEMAKALLCERRQQVFEACDGCDACHLVDAETHPDFFSVGVPEDKNEFPIDLMRELCQNFQLKTARGKGKIAIVDDADDLNEESANCFLKTLEEPPPGSVFFLIATSRDRQMPTILSRCHMVQFAPLSAELMRGLLAGDELDPAMVARVIPLASGSPGQARQLAVPELWDFRQNLLRGLTQPRPDTLALAREFTKLAENAGKETASHRQRAALMLQLLIEALNDAASQCLGGSARSSDSADRAVLHALAARADPEKFLEAIERCMEAEVQLDRYVMVGLVLEGLMDRLGQLLGSPPARHAS